MDDCFTVGLDSLMVTQKIVSLLRFAPFSTFNREQYTMTTTHDRLLMP